MIKGNYSEVQSTDRFINKFMGYRTFGVAGLSINNTSNHFFMIQ